MANDVDLLEGVDAIAAFLGTSRRRASHLVETRAIPFFKMGGRICALRSSLLERMKKLEQENEPAPEVAAAG